MKSKIYFSANEKNLGSVQSTLKSKYKDLQFFGSTIPLESIKIVSSRHVIEEFDVFIIMNQNFHLHDIQSKFELTNELNKACIYALKDLPIYFLVREDNKELEEHLKNHCKGSNVRIFRYVKPLTVIHVESVIKEVLVHREDPENIQASTHKLMENYLENQRNKKLETQIDRALSIRSKNDSRDFMKLSNIEALMKKFGTAESPSVDLTPIAEHAAIFDTIKTNMFDNAKTITPTIGIRSFDDTPLKQALNPEAIRRDILKTDPDYASMEVYVQRLKETIAAVENSEEPDKHSKVLMLMEEKISSGNELHELMMQYTAKLIRTSMSHLVAESSQDLENLKAYGDKLRALSEVEGGQATVAELKIKRQAIIDEMKTLIENFQNTAGIVRTTLEQLGKGYMQQLAIESTELASYATNHSLSLVNVNLPSEKVIADNLSSLYQEVCDVSNQSIAEAQKVFNKVAELIHIDNKIIDTQDNVIQVLSTQKIQKNIVVDNILTTKLYGIVGPDGAGKTYYGLNLAHAYSNNGYKTLLVDLNLKSPSLRFYNSSVDPLVTQDNYFNNFTITFEEFLKLSADDENIYSNIPFHKNLSIIQPDTIIDLEKAYTFFSPKAFDFYVKNFLEKMAYFFDKIIVILPELLEDMGDVLDNIGYLTIVCDFNRSNIEKCASIRKDFGWRLDKSPSRTFIANKVHKSNEISFSDYTKLCNIDTRLYKSMQLIEIVSAVNDKLQGNIAYLNNPNVKRVFDDLAKR